MQIKNFRMKVFRHLILIVILLIANGYCYILDNKTLAFEDFDNLNQNEVTPWGVENINSPLMWSNGITGAKVKIAILDTGVDFSHPDLDINIHNGFNAINVKDLPDDDNGHGTMVTGIISANHNNFGIRGIAPDADIYPVKVLDRFGKGNIRDIIRGINWCVENNIQIINMSFSLKDDNLELKEVIQSAVDRGIIIVASADNTDEDSARFPASYKGVISVVSMNKKNKMQTSINSRKIDFAAPGIDILSTKMHGGYGTSFGNSLAAPHLTGAIALLKAKEPEISYNDIVHQLGEANNGIRFLHLN
ncbi:S8 family peptidase [Paenibacillus xylanexedens]|uniref:S8 family peptidase n=1 Tax=Paenibacillus xylanexedens TaxID=528191 RepID=UPI001F359FE5|nr:S8 family peptidase [Paenibacillus xylanexedens]MCF7758662.1 S8 family peptidase [Paenibacillus xylanexedens]